jgi:hypothetical protein
VSARTAARLAWSLCVGGVVGVCGLVLFNVLNGNNGLASWPQLATTWRSCWSARWLPPASHATVWDGCCSPSACA